MFDPSKAFIDCPRCDSASHVERVKGEQWFCNCCSHQFAVPSTAPEAGSLLRRVAQKEVRQPTAARR
jgi:ribosomal protein L37AE/L43A